MSTNANDLSPEYDIGRGKPPRHSRFVKGRSGNPGGRKKGSLNLKTVLKAVMESQIKLTEGGRARHVPMLEAMILRTAQEALRGRLQAVELLLDRYERLVGNEATDEREMSEEDELLIARALGDARIAAADHQRAAPDSEGADDV